MLRTAIVGSGFIGQAHMEALNRMGSVDVVAISDLNAASPPGFRGDCFTDYRSMIDEIKPDVVHVCSPNNLHYEICRYALERDIHVFCEKPFTLKSEHARELVQLAEVRNLKNAVNYQNRMYPMVQQIKSLIEDGQLGQVVTAHGSYLQDWLLYETDFSWRLLSESVGSTRALADIGSHWLDLLEYVTGLRIAEVIARFCTYYPERKKPKTQGNLIEKSLDTDYELLAIDTEDCVSLMFTLSNGAPGTLLISQMFAGKKNQLSLLIGGDKMSAQWESEDCNNLVVGRRDAPNLLYTKDKTMLYEEAAHLTAYPGGHSEGFPDAILQGFRQFYRSIEIPDGQYGYATFRDGLKQVLLGEAIQQSFQEQAFITLKEEKR